MSKVKITLEDLFNLPGSQLYNPDPFNYALHVSTDTRTIKPNSIFFALKGDNFDGHNFVREAVKKGAAAVIINRNKLRHFDDIDCTIVTVKNTVISYGDLAKVWRSRLSAKVIGITGSNGKTTTKEMAAALLSKHYRVSKTLSNNNNHIGVPLTIFSTNEKHNYLILELGTNHFGEIAYTSAIASPDISVITNIGDSHLEFLKDRKGVAKEKLALLDITDSKKGKVLINIDDKILNKKADYYKNKVTFGFNNPADIKGEILKSDRSNLPIVKVIKGKTSFKVELPVYGNSNAKNFLIAAAIALESGLTKSQILEGVSQIKAVDKRLNVKDINGFTLVNDTYNANPESMKAALKFVNSLNSGKKKVVILGDMFELGEKGVEAHKELSIHIKKNKINEVYTIGKLMKNLSDELRKTKILNKHFISRDSLSKYIMSADFENGIILVKGSRGMKMEDFVRILETRQK